jgi:glutathione peroxidase
MTKKLLIVLALLGLPQMVLAQSIHTQKIKSIGGKQMNLSEYKGKPILLVNIATKCGYTPQLNGLEKVYQKYKDQGLVVLGIPSNDFGGQTPENNEGVKKFCKLNYGVTFPLTEKAVVRGEQKHPLIASLITQSSNKKEIGWNFEKFLVNKDGKLVERFGSSTSPEDAQLAKKIEGLL